MIIEQGSPIRVVMYAPGCTGFFISKNGAAFTGPTGVSAVGSDYFYAELDTNATNTLGSLVVVFDGAPAGTYTVVQVRSVVREIVSNLTAILSNTILAPAITAINTASSDIKGIVGKLVSSLSSIRRGALP